MTDRISEIFSRLKKKDSAPRTELDYTNPYTLLVAVALSAQATDIGVNKATKELFKIVDTPQKMLELGEEKLKNYIKTVGLFNTKAANVIKAARILVDQFGGVVPQTREELVTLPGVGRKTANVVLNEAFGHSTIAVDTHILRVSNRLGLSKEKTPDAVEKDLEEIIPEKYKRHAHIWLILHGRHTCKARKPECGRCVLADLCASKDKTV
jgi:endonuclease-3